MSLHQAFVRLLAWLIGPLALGSVVLVIALAIEAQHSVERELQTWSSAVVDVVDHHLSRSRVKLEAIAALPDLDRGALDEVYRFATNVIADTPGTLVVLVRADGQILVNTSRPFGTALPKLWHSDEQPTKTDSQGHTVPIGPRGLPRELFSTGQVAHSNLFFGVNISGPRMAVAIPVKRKDTVPYLLRLSYPVEDLRRLLPSALLPSAARVVLLDRSGTVIATNGVSPYAIEHRLSLPESPVGVQQVVEPDGTATIAHTPGQPADIQRW